MPDKMHQLMRTKERFEAFVSSAPIGIASSHIDGRVFEANDTYLDLIGYTRAELEEGKVLWTDLTPKELVYRDREAIEEAVRTGRSHAFEKEYIRKDGSHLPILIGFAIVGPDRDEALTFVIDMTGQKSAEAEVRRLNTELEARVASRTAELEASNKELEAFCYAVSHDLRAPLRSIDGFAYALLQDYEDKLDDDGKDFIGRIRAASKRMDELISALLSLSRLTTTELDRQTVNLSELAEAVTSDLMHANPNRSIEFSIEPNLLVQGDRRTLRAVLDNLLNNAVKFTVNQEVAKISLEFDKSVSAFAVRDNGVGFEMEQSSKLFQPFERLHSPREFSGSGIGLATVYRIIRKHGGHIWAHAEINKGAEFFFTLVPSGTSASKPIE